MSRFCHQESVNRGTPQPCTREIFEGMLSDPAVKAVCERIGSLDPQAEGYADEKNRLKRQLPIIIPHAQSFKGTKRKSEDAEPSGLVMLDVDHVADPQSVYAQQVAPVVEAQRIYFAAITPSGHGLRLIAERLRGEAIEDAQCRLAKACGFEQIDGVTKDLARASYMMPREMVLHYDPQALFEAPKEEDAMPALAALPAGDTSEAVREDALAALPAGDTSEAAGEGALAALPAGETPDAAEEGALAADEPAYKGIPYSAIAQQLMALIGSGDGAEQGERNTVYFSLANYMRYICDFNADLLLSALPAFGLSEEERRRTIHSALGRPRKNYIPATLQSAITICEQQRKTEKAFELTPIEELVKGVELPRLPRLLQLVLKRVPETYRPALIIALLPVLGTLATRVRFLYLDKQKHSLSFFSCISAPAASGKSCIRKPIDLLLTPINEQDAIERKKEQDYKEQLRATKNAKMQPQDPHACPRNNGVNISIAKLLQLLTYAEGKHLIGICEEMDTLLKTERAGTWSQKSDIYRLGFDNAEYGQAYMSDNSFSAKVPVYYNLLLTGTPGSMHRFFKQDTIENGLMTRTCFAQLPDTSYAEMPVFEPYSQRERDEIIGWARKLDQEEGEISCTVVERAIAQWVEEKRQRALDADNHAADVLRRRCAVIGFRAGMLCFLLENRIPKRSIGEFATWVAEYVFVNQMELFGDKLEQELTASLDRSERGSLTALIDLLPPVFCTHDLIALRAKRGQSVKPNAVATLLLRWEKAGRITKLAPGQYQKQ